MSIKSRGKGRRERKERLGFGVIIIEYLDEWGVCLLIFMKMKMCRESAARRMAGDIVLLVDLCDILMLISTYIALLLH